MKKIKLTQSLLLRTLSLALLACWLPATIASAQNASPAKTQHPVDTTKVSINNYYGDRPTNADAANTVTRERMNKGMITNSLDALSGQAADVQVQTGGNHEAMLSAVRVRGTTSLTGGNDPLVVIDGVQSDIVTLSTIYPADIESFTILKDASETSQYGSRGAAGVIQVVTRKGRAGQFHIAYDGSVGFESTYKNLHPHAQRQPVPSGCQQSGDQHDRYRR